jgi:hypothetical protein
MRLADVFPGLVRSTVPFGKVMAVRDTLVYEFPSGDSVMFLRTVPRSRMETILFMTTQRELVWENVDSLNCLDLSSDLS